MSIGESGVFARRVSYFRSSEIRELLRLIGADVISFAGGAPDPKTFPDHDQLMDAFEYIADNKDVAIQYGVTEGDPSFRKELSKFMRRNMNIKADVDEIMVTVGSQMALDILGRIFLERNARVVVELPTYIAAVQAFSIYRPRFIGVRLEEDGMDTYSLEEKIRRIYSRGGRIRFLYTIPTGHNPGGTIMSYQKRKHLLELAEKYDFYIVEDDPYGFITFRSNIPPRLKSMDRSGHVIYISSLSKIFGPGLRIGWVAGPREVVRVMGLAAQSIDLCPPRVNQWVAEYFLKTGLIEDNIPRIREIYRVKRDAMLDALDSYMADIARWTRPDAGFFVFLTLPKEINTRKLLYEAVEKVKVAYVPGAGFFVDGSGLNTIRLSYSLPPPERIEIGVRRLASFLREKIEALGLRRLAEA